MVNALPVKPMLLRNPSPDLLLDRFTPGQEGAPPRIYPADLARAFSCFLGGQEGCWVAGTFEAVACTAQLWHRGSCEPHLLSQTAPLPLPPAVLDAFSALDAADELAGSDDDAFSDALSRQASLGPSDSECFEPAPTPAEEQQQQQAATQDPARDQQPQQPAAQQQEEAPTRRSGKPLLQRVMEALKQQGHLEQKPAAAADHAPQQPQQPPASPQQAEGAGQPPVTDGPSTPTQQQQQPRLPPLPGEPGGRGSMAALQRLLVS